MALTKVSGSILKDPLNLGGQVSIGGTLTYEDVTNVDSVGIITARAGINISGGNLQIGGTNVINSGRALYNLHSLKLGDSKELILGTGNDLKIYHSGTHSFIDEVGNGALKIKGDDIRFENASGTEAVRITSAGDVGIGTAIPVIAGGYGNLSLAGSTGGQLELKRVSTDIRHYIWGNTDLNIGGGYHNGSSSSIVFRVNGSNERLRIIANGGVGINTSNFSSSLNNEVGLAIHGQSNDNCRIVFTTPTKSSPPSLIGYYGLNRFGVDTYDGLEIRDVTDSYATRLRIGSGGGIKINCNETYYAANLTECNTGQLAFNINKTRQGQTKGIAFGAIGNSTTNTGIQCYDTSNNSANPLLLNPFGGNVGIYNINPKSRLHLGSSQDIRIGDQYGGMASMQQQVSYSSGYTGTHWQFKTTGGISWSFDGVLIVHGTGGSSYGSEVVHIKIVYSRESGATNSGDTWRNGSVDYNVETLEHGQVGLAPSSGDLTIDHDSTPGGATGYSLLKLGWSASGQGVGVWSKLIGNFYWGAPSSGDVEIQDKDANIVFNSNP